MEFMFSKQGKKLIIYSNFKFYKGYKTKEGVKWRCTNRKCSAKLFTDENETIILKSELNHNHAQDDNLARQIISNSSKRIAEENIFEKPSKIMKEVISDSPHTEKMNKKDIEYIRKNMYRARRKNLPVLPTNFMEVHFSVEDTMDAQNLCYKKDMEGIQASQRISQSHPEVAIALFGLGRIGMIHLDNLRRNQRARVMYCVEESAERVNFLQNKWILTEAEFLKPEEKEKVFEDKRVDAVIICSPTFAHEELVLKSLESGKTVFCEKPLALSDEGIERCLKAVKKSSKPLLTAFNRRFDPGLRSLKSRVDAGEIGKVQMIKTCSRDSPKPPTEYLKNSGGIFHDCAVHDIDYICWILGEYPESVSSYAHANFEDVKELGDYDTVAIMMKFPSGAIGIIDLSRHAVYGYDQRVEIFGNKGMLTNGEQRPVGVKSHNEKGTTAVPIPFSFASRYQEAYSAEMEHFLNVCQGIEECEVTPESVLAISKVATACEQAAKSEKSLSLNLNGVPNGH